MEDSRRYKPGEEVELRHLHEHMYGLVPAKFRIINVGNAHFEARTERIPKSGIFEERNNFYPFSDFLEDLSCVDGELCVTEGEAYKKLHRGMRSYHRSKRSLEELIEEIREKKKNPGAAK